MRHVTTVQGRRLKTPVKVGGSKGGSAVMAKKVTRERRPRPPLMAWVWAFLFAFLAIGGFFTVSAGFVPPKSGAFYRFNAPRIEQFAALRAAT